MQQWKPWQIVFLFYLLTLNCVIVAALGYLFLKIDLYADFLCFFPGSFKL